MRWRCHCNGQPACISAIKWRVRAAADSATPFGYHRDGCASAGAVIGNIVPDAVLDEAAITAYGALSIGDLVAQASAQNRNRTGGNLPPVILVNGRRIVDPTEVQGLPPEAILRFELLPPEAGLPYGYDASQRVMNIVLKPHFSASIGTTSINGITSGDYWGERQDTSLVQIRAGTRISIDGFAYHQAPLLESDRNIRQENSNTGDGLRRSLLSSANGLALGFAISRPIGVGTNVATRVRAGTEERHALIGPSPLDNRRALRQSTATNSAIFGAAADGRTQGWNWNLSASYSVTDARTISERVSTTSSIDILLDSNRNHIDQVEAGFAATGNLLRLPAGNIRLSVQGISSRLRLSAVTQFGDRLTQFALSRQTWGTGLTLDLPLTSRNGGVLSGLGDLSVTAQYARHSYSDFGTVSQRTLALRWGLTPHFDIGVNIIRQQQPPDIAALGAPQLVTPLRPIFDFSRGETVLVEMVSGGNPQLRAERRGELHAEMTWRPPMLRAWSFTMRTDWTATRDANNVLPFLTQAVEAAFPARVIRSGNGQIVRIDQRSVNLARILQRQIGYSVNFSHSPPPTDTPGGRPSRWSLSINHVIALRNQVDFEAIMPALDLLHGDALGWNGGTSRHILYLRGNWSQGILTLRADANWSSGSTIVGSTAPSLQRLRFSPALAIKVNATLNLGRSRSMVLRHPIFDGLIASLQINNLLGSYRRVTDGDGSTPFAYQAGFIDPAGRNFTLSLRKQF